MKSISKKQLRRTILCALFAGIVAAPFAAQTAYALPIEGANAATNKTEADISTSGTVMDITGKTDHNILKWEDFSIEQNEKVRFDGGNQTRDYLNLVTGEGASNIYGTIEGGRNVYLVNPHGILFAKGSQVNTGALYLSTANPNDLTAATNTFKANGTSPLSATAQTGDVLNLGTVKASKLYIEGKNVKVLNTDAVTDTNGTALTGANVTIRSEDAPHIGYDVANRATANFDESGGSVSHSFYDYANPNTAKSASARGWDVANLGGTAHTDYDYMCVHDVYDLQNINAKRDGRYILAGDIDAGVTNTWNRTSNGIEGFHPIGGNGSSDAKFMGNFDGVGHTIEGLYIRHIDQNRIGLFGNVNGAHIENVSLKDSHVTGKDQVGGIVGNAESEKINHVVWKSGSVTQESGVFTAAEVGVSSFVRKTDVQECTDAQLKQTATYTDWKDEDDKAVVATEGGKGTPWRIYDGKTTPLLTGLMKGTKRLAKSMMAKHSGLGMCTSIWTALPRRISAHTMRRVSTVIRSAMTSSAAHTRLYRAC